MSAGRVVVVGGGVAGITAALDCADAGAGVTLVEVRPRLGGAAYSFPREGIVLDNGQHVFLRCCTAYRALLRRLGSEPLTRLQPRLHIPVLRPGARPAALRRSGLPAPLHLAGALARYPLLSIRQRMSAARAALALARLDPADPALDRRTLGSWLSEHGQDEHAIAALWDLIALPTLNVRAREASLALAVFVFRTGLLTDAAAGDVGVHQRPLAEIVGDPAARELRRAGVDVRLGWRCLAVRAVEQTDDRGERAARSAGAALLVEGAEGRLEADAVVVAVPHTRAAELLPARALEGARWPGALESSPIVNLHAVYDRRVLDVPFAAGVDTPVQYVFDRTAALDGPGQYVAISLSGASEEMAMDRDSLRARYEPALAELLPKARAARLQSFLVTREHAATFRAAPGVGALRPPAQTALDGVVLAGSWTDTGWPATLEGATISGHRAAQVVRGGLAGRRVEQISPPAPAAAEVARL